MVRSRDAALLSDCSQTARQFRYYSPLIVQFARRNLLGLRLVVVVLVIVALVSLLFSRSLSPLPVDEVKSLGLNLAVDEGTGEPGTVRQSAGEGYIAGWNAHDLLCLRVVSRVAVLRAMVLVRLCSLTECSRFVLLPRHESNNRHIPRMRQLQQSTRGTIQLHAAEHRHYCTAKHKRCMWSPAARDARIVERDVRCCTDPLESSYLPTTA